MTRAPRFAGRYYFADAGRLRASVESFIEDSNPTRITGAICALIVPHGTHSECGALAGFAYKLLLTAPLTWDNTTLFAPTISNDPHTLLCDSSDAYDTPIDPVRIDQALIENLQDAGLTITPRPDDEPVIECHLPFIQVALGDVAVMPLRVPTGFNVMGLNVNVIGDGTLNHVADHLGLIIATATLPPSHEQAACDAITRLDDKFFTREEPIAKPRRLTALFSTKRTKLPPSADASVLALAIQMAKAKGANEARLLKREGQLAAFVLYHVRGTKNLRSLRSASAFRFFTKRQPDAHACAQAIHALRLNLPAVRLDDLLANG